MLVPVDVKREKPDPIQPPDRIVITLTLSIAQAAKLRELCEHIDYNRMDDVSTLFNGTGSIGSQIGLLGIGSTCGKIDGRIYFN